MNVKKWLVTNEYDPNNCFEIEADTLENALITALSEVGWNLSEVDEEDETDEEI